MSVIVTENSAAQEGTTGRLPLPLTTRYSPLATRYSPLATRYSLLATRHIQWHVRAYLSGESSSGGGVFSVRRRKVGRFGGSDF
jgi:hypothetical protein